MRRLNIPTGASKGDERCGKETISTDSISYIPQEVG